MPGPTLRRRRLAAELRRYREAAGMTIEQAAKTAGISSSHLSRAENALVGVRVPTVKALLGAYQVGAAEALVLVDVAKEAGQRGWWHQYGEAIPDQYATYIGFEADAVAVSNFEATAMPGLLQTEGYARAMFRGSAARIADDKIAQRVEVRLARQGILTRHNPPRFWFVLDEAVIRRAVGGPRVMAEQLRRVSELAALPHVDVQVVPFSVGAHPGMPGSFVILTFVEASDPAVVYIETMTGDLYPEREAEVSGVMLVFDRLRAVALSPEDSIRYIREAAKE